MKSCSIVGYNIHYLLINVYSFLKLKHCLFNYFSKQKKQYVILKFNSLFLDIL